MQTTPRPILSNLLQRGGAAALAMLAATALAHAAAPLPAFPGAQGFGATATGGRGGAVYHVTTLADAGPGSFRDAVSQPNRIVVFDVGGVVRLEGNVALSSNLTIAGQTAPGEGICLYGRGVGFTGQSNIIIRYLRFREGIVGDRGKKSLGMDRSDHVIVDHCSIEWGRWDDLGITVNSHDVTIQNCLVAEAISPQSFGALIDSVSNVTLSHNLWMSNESRNPKVKGTVQYINNLVYNWGFTGLCGGHSARDHSLDVIGNYFIKGPASENDHFAGQFLKTDHVYQADNLVDLNGNGVLDGVAATPAEFHRADEKPYTDPTWVSQPAMHPAIAVTTDPAAVAYEKVAASVGCSLRRDAVDARLIRELKSLGKEGKTIPHKDPRGEALAGGLQPVAGGAAPADADRDGIPDAWETAHGLNPNDAADAAKVTTSGYTELEVYVNGLVR